MDEKTRNELALFRFALIAPLVNKTVTESAKDYLERICAQPHQVPGLGHKEFSPNTLKRWLLDYRRYGLEGLKRKPRNDRGLSRTLTAKMAQTIREMKELNPHQTTTNIYNTLLVEGILGSPPVSLSTVQRFIKNMAIPVEILVERKRFAFEFANECWQTDTLFGPFLIIDGKKKRTYLMLFLDDASRLLITENSFSRKTHKTCKQFLKRQF